MIKIKHIGNVSYFNGVDIDQRKEYVKLHATTYIEKLISQYEWLKNNTTPMYHHPLPMDSNPQHIENMESAEPLTSLDKQQLEKDLGFSYCQGVGKIIYAMITCCQDI